MDVGIDESWGDKLPLRIDYAVNRLRIRKTDEGDCAAVEHHYSFFQDFVALAVEPNDVTTFDESFHGVVSFALLQFFIGRETFALCLEQHERCLI